MTACPLKARAQPAFRHYRIGVLDTSARQVNGNFKVLQQTLQGLGYEEGQNLELRIPLGRWPQRKLPGARRLSLRADVDVIVTRGTPAALAAKAATATIRW